MKNKYEIFIDLDGVLADFDRGIQHVMDIVHDGKVKHVDSDSDPEYEELMWETVGVYHSEWNGELWYGLPLMKDANDLWNYITDHKPKILTATGNPIYNAGDQKKRWVAELLDPNVMVHLARRAREKCVHAGPNRILIDDKMKAITPWENAGGIGILHTSAENTIRQLKKLGI